ncbi:unnamed protein product [Ostreobium quekettii]|uniref:Carrier domain-containing protein n=1 Tax=Ostreobium quekettii TaxID=121088 RepID=A0A8S1J654_9CHLO|nr:unnamed protein product [Ostreobium quekettii]
MSASAAGPCAEQRSPQGNTVFFRTGDLGIVDDKGLLTIVGRADLQVKVNGVRVDVLEVETRLEEHPMVTSAAVKAWPTPVAGGQVLVAYIVPTALPAQYNAGTGSAGANDFESQLLFDQLRSWLGSSLPQAAIPSSFQIATQLPKSCAGKVARGQLPPPNWANHQAHWKPKWGQQNSTVAPPHPVESVDCQPVHSTDAYHETLVTCSQAPPEHGGLRFTDGTVKGNTSQGQMASCGLEPMVLSAFADVLCWGDFNQRKVSNLEPTSNFFQHGGTSLSAISLASKLKVEPSVVHALPTPRELAQFIAGGHDVALKHLHSQHLRSEQDTRMPSFVWLEHQTRLCPTSQVGAVAPTWTLRRRVAGTGGEYVAGDPILDAVDGHKQAATTTVTCMQRSKKPKLMDSHRNQQYHQATELTSVQHCFVCPKDSNGRTVSDQANIWNSRLEHGDLRGCHCYCLSGLSSSKLEGGHGHVGMQATGRDAWPLSADGDVRLSLIATQAPRPPQEGHTSQPPCHNNCDDEGSLSAQWSHQMSQCVDAPPVVVLFPATENEIRCGACASCACGLALASSHGGDVACLSLTCGDVLWTTNVGNRADAGLTVTSDMQSVAVACRVGTIYFLRLVDGIVLGQVNVGGEIRSPPLVDPWEGYIWVGTHGRDVVAAMSPGIIVLTHPVQEPILCSIAFGGLDRCVYVATLGGTAMALRFKGGRRGADEVCTKWAHELGAPIFSSPQVDGATGIVVCATVKGTVVAISASSGDLVWARNLHATVFAPASVSPKGMEECVLVPTHAGSVHCLALATGEVMAAIHLHEGPISNPVSAGFCLPCLHSSSCPLMGGAPSARSCGSGGRENDCGAVGPESVCLVAVCNNAGCLVILKMVHAPELAVQVIASLEFPGEVFSSPTIAAGKVVLGCRDDRLYCVDLGAMIQSSFNKESQ